MKKNLETEATRVTLKGFKFVESTNGYHYTATAFIDGVKVGVVEDMGTGGSLEFAPETTPNALAILSGEGVTVDATNPRYFKMIDVYEFTCLCEDPTTCSLCNGSGKMDGNFELLIGTAAHNLICEKMEAKERKREEANTKRFIEKNLADYRTRGFSFYSLHYAGSKVASMKPYRTNPDYTEELIKLQVSNPQITDIKMFAIPRTA